MWEERGKSFVKKKQKREREREKLNLFQNPKCSMCLKGVSVFGFSIFFSFCFCASFGKELFTFKGGEEEEEEDSII